MGHVKDGYGPLGYGKFSFLFGLNPQFTDSQTNIYFILWLIWYYDLYENSLL